MQFHNNTDLPITVSSWMRKYLGVSEFIDTIVLPNTVVTVYSDVGEWIIGSLFYEEDFDKKWEEENLPHHSCIAKFSNEPDINRNYTWNFVESYFKLEYKKQDNTVTWSRAVVW
jgi:hypothetical protein